MMASTPVTCWATATPQTTTSMRPTRRFGRKMPRQPSRHSDAHPPRLEIALPAGLGAKLAPAAAAAGATGGARAGPSYFYSCMRCNAGGAVGCLDPRRRYDAPHLERARQGAAPCLYYDPAPMAAICAMHPDAERNFEFHWWCHDVERHVVSSAVRFAWQKPRPGAALPR